MRSTKPGRGPSGLSFIGSVFAVVFGTFWIMSAFPMIRGIRLFGVIIPIFVFFLGMGIATAIYHYKNATGKNRFSKFDITESGEEGDPADDWMRRELEEERRSGRDAREAAGRLRYCPYCAAELNGRDRYCPQCGKQLP